MSRKTVFQILVVVMTLAMIAACAQQPAAPAPTQAPTKAPAAPAPTSAPAATFPPAAVPATAAPAATAATAAGGPVKGGVLRVGYGAEIDTLNAFTSQNLTDIELVVAEGLIVSNDKFQYIPVLAKQIPTVENGLIKKNDKGQTEMTWQLQQGVKWHDGVEFTSADVCFTWQFIVSKDSQVYNRDEYLPIVDCKEPDKYTAVMVWDVPTAGYAKLFEAMLPKHVLEGKDVTRYDPYNRSPLGTGPFMFKEWKTGEYVRLVRNPNYWRGTQYPYLDEIVFQFIPDTNTKLNAIKAGEQQWAQITTVQIKEVKDLKGYQIQIAPQNSWIRFDTSIVTDRGKKLFGDKSVRQALAYAIDRKNIADKVMEGTVQVADSVVPVSSQFYNPDVPKYAFDPAKAKQMLEAAGWKVGSDGVRTKDGERFSFEILYRAGRADRASVSQVIQSNLKDVGIEVKVTSMDNAALTKQWRTGQWEATVSGWTLPADPSFTNLYACKGGNNFTGYCDEELDKLMTSADQALDANVRKPLMLQAQAKLMDDMFSLPMFNNVAPVIYTDKLMNFKNSGTNLGPMWNAYEWYLAK